MSTTTSQIINGIKDILGDTYTVIDCYDATEQIDLNGVIAINISSLQNLHNGTQQDYKLSIEVNGQYLTQQDKNKSKIYRMFNYCMNKLKVSALKQIQNVAGCSIQSGSISSDGQSNNFTVNIELYVCDMVFNSSDSSDSSSSI